MNYFIEVFINLYVVMNLLIALVIFVESVNDHLDIFDVRMKHLLLLLFLPIGVIVGVLCAAFMEAVDTVLYMIKKSERLQGFANKKIFKRKE